jgi:hypothetical protein
MKLTTISLTSLHNLESGQFITRFFSDFTGTGLSSTTDAEFDNIFVDLSNQLPTYNLALAQIAAQQESEMLLSLDAKRDKKVTALRFAWNAYRSSDDVAKKAAYTQLKPLMNNYKNIGAENFEAESLGLDLYIAGLNSPENASAVGLLNMGEHIVNLETANNSFKTTFSNRSNATVNTTVYNTKLLRKSIFDTYKELANYTLTMANRRTPSPFFVTVLEAINNGRAYYANIIAHRGSGGTTPTV